MILAALTTIIVTLIIVWGVRDMRRFDGNLRLQLDNLVQARSDREAALQREANELAEENAQLRAGNLAVQQAAQADRDLHKVALDTLERRLAQAETRLTHVMAPGRRS